MAGGEIPAWVAVAGAGITAASGYREEVAAALRSFDASDDRSELPGSGLWGWTNETTQDVKAHESEWALAEAAVFCGSNKHYIDDPKTIPENMRSEAQNLAGGAVADTVQPLPTQKVRFLRRWRRS
jgi:hypothetical protein